MYSTSIINSQELLIKYLKKYLTYLIKLTAAYSFFGLVCHYEHVSCMKVDVIGKLSEGAYQNWRYLYYSQRPNIYFEEIINFYTYNNSKNGFGIIKYNYLGQQNVITKSF